MTSALDYGRIYRHWHSCDAADIHRQKAFLNRMLSGRLPKKPAAPILDLGCALGYTLHLLRDLGYTDLLGIDRDPGLLASCREAGLPVEGPVDAATFLRAHPNRYDTILALDLLEHIPVSALSALLAAIHGALRPGGSLVFSTPNATSPLAMRWRSICWTHTTAFTTESIGRLLAHAGFAPVEVTGFEIVPPARLPWLPRPGLFRRWLLASTRLGRRLELIAELGWPEGCQEPLAPHLTGRAVRS